MIQRQVERGLGYPVGVIVRRLDELEAMAAMDPFRGVPRGPRTKLLITLLSSPPDDAFHAPYSAPGKDFTIMRVTDDAVLPW